MPGAIAACAVSCRLCRVNFAGSVTWSDKAETEAFQASGGLNASRIRQCYQGRQGKGVCAEMLIRFSTETCGLPPKIV
jgi:hypothetical protein